MPKLPQGEGKNTKPELQFSQADMNLAAETCMQALEKCIPLAEGISASDDSRIKEGGWHANMKPNSWDDRDYVGISAGLMPPNQFSGRLLRGPDGEALSTNSYYRNGKPSNVFSVEGISKQGNSLGAFELHCNPEENSASVKYTTEIGEYYIHFSSYSGILIEIVPLPLEQIEFFWGGPSLEVKDGKIHIDKDGLRVGFASYHMARDDYQELTFDQVFEWYKTRSIADIDEKELARWFEELPDEIDLHQGFKLALGQLRQSVDAVGSVLSDPDKGVQITEQQWRESNQRYRPKFLRDVVQEPESQEHEPISDAPSQVPQIGRSIFQRLGIRR